MYRVMLGDYKEPMNRDLEIEKKFLQDYFSGDVIVDTFIYEDDNEKFLQAIEGVQAILTAYIPFDDALLKSCAEKGLKFISIEATGYNSVDIKAAEKYGIGVSVIGEYCTQEVSDHTITLALAVARNLKIYQKDIEQNHRFDFMAAQNMIRLEGSTFGVMGFGKIGQAVAKKAQGFGMKTIAYDPYCSEETAKALNTTLVSKDEVLKQSNIISLNMLLTKETKGFLGKCDFEKMEKCPVLVNVARGALIDEDALLWALDNKKIYGAGLDVLVDETYEGTEKTPLVGRDDVVITPHSAFYSDYAMQECCRLATGNMYYYLIGSNDKVNKMLNICNITQK